MKLSRGVKTAIIVITDITAFLIGFNSLKSKSIFNKANTYYAYSPHSGGLKAGTQITVNGVKVGNVEAAGLEEKTAEVKITMGCSDDFPFSRSSVAELYNSLLGGTGLQIIPALDNTPIAVSDDVLEARIREDMFASISSSIRPTREELNHLLNQIGTALTGINKVLDIKAFNDLEVAIAGISIIIRNLNQASVTLNELLANGQNNLRSTLQDTNKIIADLAKVSGELSEVELNKVMADAQTTLNNLSTLLADIEGGKGTIGKLMKDGALYKGLGKSARQLKLLLQDLRLDPKCYVYLSIFGKKAKAYGPQDEEESG